MFGFIGEKCLRMRRAGKVIGLEVKCRLNVVKMKEEMAAFLCQWQCYGFVASVRDRKLLWSKFLVICVV